MSEGFNPPKKEPVVISLRQQRRHIDPLAVYDVDDRAPERGGMGRQTWDVLETDALSLSKGPVSLVHDTRQRPNF